MFALSYILGNMPRTITGINDTKDMVQMLIQIINNEEEEQRIYHWAENADWGDRYENTKLHIVVNCYRESLNVTPVGVVTRDGKIVDSSKITKNTKAKTTGTNGSQVRKEKPAMNTESEIRDTKSISETLKNSFGHGLAYGHDVNYQEVIWENKSGTSKLVLTARAKYPIGPNQGLVITFRLDKKAGNGVSSSGEMELRRNGGNVEDAFFISVSGGMIHGDIPKAASTKASRIINNLVLAGCYNSLSYITR